MSIEVRTAVHTAYDTLPEEDRENAHQKGVKDLIMILACDALYRVRNTRLLPNHSTLRGEWERGHPDLIRIVDHLTDTAHTLITETTD